MKRRILSSFLALALALSLLPASALAADATNVPYLDKDGTGQTCDTATVVDSTTPTAWNAGWYYVQTDTSINGRITASGEVHLILGNGATLTASKGISVTEGNSLTIYAQSKGGQMGSLTAKNDSYKAAIGSDYSDVGGTITINGGTVNATSDGAGAAIGGGGEGTGGTIIINGGTVNATSTMSGAGIGGGQEGAGGTIIIEGGTVNANSNDSGAGIGGGTGGAGGEITIKGGEVKATSNYGAAIGGGFNGDGGEITISGGTVNATSTMSGAAIGGGEGEAGGEITISGGTVTAENTFNNEITDKGGAAIGGGTGGAGGTIIIEGGTVTATSAEKGAAIGGGTGGAGGEITIKGGEVKATSNYGAAIGGGKNGDGGKIIIGGGEVTATSDFGAGIGGGYNGAGGTITISDGIVEALSKGNMATGVNSGAGIGGGTRGAGGTITIEGGTVNATGGSGAGIGGGANGDGGKIIIGGGEVTATSNFGTGIGGGYNGAGGTFSTGDAGNAFIAASSISDSSDEKKKNWSGIIFVGNSGQVYGSITLAADAEIPSGKTLTIPATASLTVEGTLTNSGALTLGSVDVLTGSGTLSGDGSFTVSGDPVGSMIVVPRNLVYTGIDQTNSAKAAISLNVSGTIEIMEKTFTVNISTDGWTLGDFNPVQVLNAGTYTVSYTKGDKTIQNTFTVAQSGSAIPAGGVKTYLGDTEQSTFHYGDTITVKVQAPQPTSVAARAFMAPTAGQMAVFKGDTQVSDAVDAVGGVYTMTMDTGEKGLSIGENTLTAKYVASGNMAAAAMDFTVTVQPKPLTATVDSTVSKAYDGSNSFTGVALTLTGVISGDTVTATAAGNAADANVGTNKTFTATSVTLDGNHKDYYTLAADKVSGSVAITPKTVSAPSITLNGDSFEYTGNAIEPSVTVKDGDTVIDQKEYEVVYSNNINVGTSATVTVNDVIGGNYTLGTATKTFEITKPSLTTATVTLTIPPKGYTYDGTAHVPQVTVTKGGRMVTSTEYDVTYSNSNGGTAGGNVNAGTVTVTVTAKADGNYSGSNSTATFEVSKKSVMAVVTAQDKTYDGKLNAVVTAEVTEGLVGTDSITITGLTGTFVDANAGTKKVVRVNSEGAVISGGDNYHVIIPGTTSANILKDMSATPPAEGEGYTIDYAAETIDVVSGYEVYTAETGGTQVLSGWVSDYLGETLYVRKVEDNNHAASGWTAFTLAARPAAPSLTKTDETLKGQKNGELQGVTTSMEYSTNSGASWTRCSGTTVTGLAGGTTVQVRLKATQTTFSGEIETYTIGHGAGITVTYQQGSQAATNMPAQLTDLSYKEKLTKPADPVAENTDFVFVGWFKDADGTEAWNFDEDTLTAGNVTLTAKWKKVYFSVTVNVTDDNSNNYDNATLTLMRGADTIDTAQSGNTGQYTFSKHVEAGMYNVVVSYTNDDGQEQTKTALIEVTQDSSTEVKLPPAGVNSQLEVADDTITPPVMVGGLDEEAEQIKTDNNTASKVTVSMAVEGQRETEVTPDVVTAIKAAVTPSSGESAPVLEYLDVSLFKQIDGTKTELTATNKVIELVVPFDFTNREDVSVVRYHGGTAEALSSLNSKPTSNFTDKTFYLDEDTGYIHIYTNKFSTYAIAYTLKTGFTVTFNANGGEVMTATATTGTDGKLTSLPTPTRSGYTFDGWYTEESGGTLVTTATVFTKDTTVYAHWTQNSSGGGGGGGTTTYPPTVEKPENGDVIITPKNPGKGDTVTITPKPDDGYEVDRVTVTDKDDKPVDVTENRDGTYTFTQPSGKVKIQVTYRPIKGEPENPFTDVAPGAYYHDAVLWAVAREIIGGTTATTFSPDETCTRAQAVTFLWRAAGSPAATGENPFTDVAPGAYYYDAVLWAVEKGITNGTDADTFSPAATVTRAQAVTFLWRAAGSPAASGGAFADVPAEAYYANAVTWAVAEDITNGTSATEFSPGADCTRTQIVTFLYRDRA